MSHYDLFGPRRLGWRPVTVQGWTMVAASIAAVLLGAYAAARG